MIIPSTTNCHRCKAKGEIHPTKDDCAESTLREKRKSPVCVECGDKCIGRCPRCLCLVCNGYGQCGSKNCSAVHDGHCREKPNAS